MKFPLIYSQLKSIMLLPIMVTVAIPFTLVRFFGNHMVSEDSVFLFKIIGVALFLIGFPLFLQSVNLFIKIGKGTLAPWDPTKNLVVKSLYRHVRNPMILGVLFILLAETFFLNSLAILVWAILFLVINQIYFVLKEEPDLLKRFGKEYKEYSNAVPRWIPRIKCWRPEEKIK